MSDRRSRGFERRGYTRLMDRYRELPLPIPLFNPAARTALRLKYGLDRMRVSLACRGRDEEIDRWFRGLRMFFGFSSFRSGTVFLADLLKRAVPDSQIEHEANVDDYWNLPGAMMDGAEGLRYVRDFRRREIFCRSSPNVRTYGEINPMLRFHCRAVAEVFPEARCFHLVRDPRDVVRSMINKGIFSKKDPFSKLIKPPPADPYSSLWQEMTAFERCCWLWQYENRVMRQNLKHLVRFEPMVRDFGYFKRELLDYLDVEIPERTWAEFVLRPVNVSRGERLGHWTNWSQNRPERFAEICGAEMARYGYAFQS